MKQERTRSKLTNKIEKTHEPRSKRRNRNKIKAHERDRKYPETEKQVTNGIDSKMGTLTVLSRDS